MSFETNYYKIFEKCTENYSKPLDSVSDDELSIAVMLRLLDIDNEKILELPLPCQYVTAIYRVIDRVYVADFVHVYRDSDIAPFVTTAIDGLLAIGEDELATIIKKSYSIYEVDKEKIIALNNGEIHWLDLSELEHWSEVTDECTESYEKCNYLNPSMANYIRKNFREFLNL